MSGVVAELMDIVKHLLSLRSFLDSRETRALGYILNNSGQHLKKRFLIFRGEKIMFCKYKMFFFVLFCFFDSTFVHLGH